MSYEIDFSIFQRALFSLNETLTLQFSGGFDNNFFPVAVSRQSEKYLLNIDGIFSAIVGSSDGMKLPFITY